MGFVEVKNLSVVIKGNKIIENISFEVEKGDVVSIIGPNGSGKTTLLKVILGLIKPSNGEIRKFNSSILKNITLIMMALLRMESLNAKNYSSWEKHRKKLPQVQKS